MHENQKKLQYLITHVYPDCDPEILEQMVQSPPEYAGLLCDFFLAESEERREQVRSHIEAYHEKYQKELKEATKEFVRTSQNVIKDIYTQIDEIDIQSLEDQLDHIQND